jgi:hypothetical protein
MTTVSLGVDSQRWPLAARLAASLLILFHLGSLAGLVLYSETGPWVTADGSGNAHPPFFAGQLFNFRFPKNGPIALDMSLYRQALRLTEDYRFPSNRRPEAAHRLQIHIRDEAGKTTQTLHFPDPDAWLGTRDLQQLIAHTVADYKSLEPIEGERIPPPGQTVPMAEYWQRTQDGSAANLRRVPEHLLPRNQQLVTPTRLADLAQKSLRRWAIAKTGGADAEVVIVSKPTFGAVTLMPEYARNIDPEDFTPVQFHFGRGH